MPRRLPVRSTALSACLTLGLASCATFSNVDVVADVGDLDVTTDDFEALSTTYFERSEDFGTAAPVDGRVDADNSRNLLTAVVRERLFQGFLDDRGIDNTDVRAAYMSEVIEPSPIGELALSDAFLDLFAVNDPQFTARSLDGVATPNIDELATMYSEQPVSTGLVCVRHILVESESEADAALDELADGAEFATVAAERSIDEASAVIGGAITGADNECIPLETVRQGFAPEFAAAVVSAQAGVPSDPVQTSFGYHVIVHRPWNEVRDAVGALYQPDVVGALMFSGYKTTADVEIDPRYGTWNNITETVDPIG